MNNLKTARNILETSLNACDSSPADYSFYELKELIKTVRDNLQANEIDYTLELCGGEVRLIQGEEIDAIQQQELENDAYCLGCFNADFLASVTGWPMLLIKAAQEGEAFEELGEVLIKEDKAQEIQEAYKSADGYGHHFAHYDHEEHSAEGFYIFRTN